MAITDIITKPVGGAIKGVFTGGLGLGAVGGVGGGALGAIAGGLISTAIVASALLVGALPILLTFGFLAPLALGAAVIAVGTLAGGLIGGATGGISGLVNGSIFGGLIGGAVGLGKGIVGVFSGETKQSAQNEKQLQTLRQQSAAEEAALRQQQRASAMSGLDNSAATGGNLSRLQAESQGQSVSQSR